MLNLILSHGISHNKQEKTTNKKNLIIMNMDMGHVTLLVLLDLSAAFDTVDHDLLTHRLQSLLGLRGTALQWFRSYLRGRSQQVAINGALSKKFGLECGVPQGSRLGPLLFTIYASKLFSIIKLTCQLHTRTQMILNYTCRFAHQRVRVKLRRWMLWRNASPMFVHG